MPLGGEQLPICRALASKMEQRSEQLQCVLAFSRCMLSIATMISLASLPDIPPTTARRREQVRVSARIVHGAEGSERLGRAHPAKRTRIVRETVADGRETRLIVFDHE